tara:strand:- start:2798 stop:3010 length:213 start_codon:yes stop_codon:yes gene_type:complete
MNDLFQVIGLSDEDNKRLEDALVKGLEKAERELGISHLSVESQAAIGRRRNELRGMSYDEQLDNLLNLED